MDVSLHPSACMDTQSATLPSPTVDDPHSRQTTKMFHCSDPGRWPLGLPAKRCVESCCHSLRRYIYMYMYIFIYLFIYLQKRTLSGPHFSTFLRMQCFCFIMFDRLCSYTCCDGITKNPHRLSDFLRGCQRMSRQA